VVATARGFDPISPATLGRVQHPLVVVPARTDLTVHGTEQPEDPTDYGEDDAEDPQDVDVQHQSENQQDDAKDDHDNHVLSP
jgi:hypothetical protein